MFDRRAQILIAPLLRAGARLLVRRGIGADAVTWTGFALGLGGALCIALGRPLAGLALILASRLADGLDGAVARLTRPTERGAFLDITLDFVFYASVPLAFALADPARHALPAAVLLAAFIGTGSSFLSFAVIAERRGLTSPTQPHKGIYYLGGLTEAGETLACFAAMCLWPAAFAALALGFALLCGLTLLARLHAGWRLLGEPG
ncbi:MAG: CDP-alcohol phosphatidyltransferase family protein [Burkholderiaceae bacterium]|nr:CDP-alcohol phosphatidyltransferase family protein [Burkholderiaceae bacterium]